MGRWVSSHLDGGTCTQLCAGTVEATGSNGRMQTPTSSVTSNVLCTVQRLPSLLLSASSALRQTPIFRLWSVGNTGESLCWSSHFISPSLFWEVAEMMVEIPDMCVSLSLHLSCFVCLKTLSHPLYFLHQSISLLFLFTAPSFPMGWQFQELSQPF